VKPGVAASFYITGIFFRSAWKYRSRAYRYVLLDAGHLLENLRLALGALNFFFSIHLDFDDQRAAILMGLDPQREVCLACVHLHHADDREKMTADADNLQPLDGDILQASTVSKKEVAYAEIAKVHRAGNVFTRSGAVDFPAGLVGQQKLPTSWINLDPPDYMESADYAHILEQRRSRRNFIPTSVSKDNLMRFMNLMVSNMGKGAAMPSACRSALVSGFLAGPGMPVPPGFYVLDPDAKRFGPVLDGRLTESMAAACLDQMWLKQAAMHLLFVTDVAALDQAWGPRGYRYAMIEAGRLGQQAYLAAAALGLGACGIGAIYDREAADLLDLTTDEVLLYLVGVGPVKMR
jgi:SagB-type dehydrogenase family enzyme